MSDDYYKSYREQAIECRAKKIQFKEHCIWCNREMSMCKKYGGQCKSSKCRDERTRANNDC